MRGDPDRAGLESDSENGQVRPDVGAAAWIAEYGIVLDVPTVGSAGDAREHSSRRTASASTHRNPNETPAEPLLIRLSAQKLWAEGRANPVWYECATWRWTSGKASNGTIGTCMSNLPKEIPLRKGTFSLDDLVAVFPAEI